MIAVDGVIMAGLKIRTGNTQNQESLSGTKLAYDSEGRGFMIEIKITGTGST